ncbi:MAG: C69 family dipeptidase [Bacillota bacterium]
MRYLQKRKKLFLSIMLTFLFVFTIGSAVGAECTMLIVGKNATEDGSILLARNEDFSPNNAKHLKINESKSYEKGETIKSINGLEWDLPEKTHKYISVEEYNTDYGRFHETAINSKFVGISATTTTSQNEKAAEADPLVKDGLGENVLTTIVAQRADSAKEGIKLIGEIIEKKGASETFGVAVADKKEVWYLENGGGHHWVAVRIPDDKYFVGANAMRIGKVDLDSQNYMGSEDLIDFAVENDLYNPDADGEFDFAKAYGTAKDYEDYNYRRVWGGYDFFTPSGDFDAEEKNYPMFAEADEKISAADAKEFMRYHYQGTKYDTYGNDSGERGVGTSSTIESHVMQLKGWLPVEIGGIQWVSISTPLASPYIPYYHGITEIPEEYQIANSNYDDESAFWAFRSVANFALNNYEEIGKDVRSDWEKFENKQYKIVDDIEAMAYKLYRDGKKDEAQELLTSYSNGQALRALHKAYNLRDKMMTDFSKDLP